ncbi:MAG: chloramphenicol acetyltransferase [Bacteroidota bacterium]
MKYPIVCFEGPSSVGKTTLCQVLSDNYQVVPEVNLLFERPKNESHYWYHEKQVERFAKCQQAPRTSILDGDIFQPIWYNWVCKYPTNFLPKNRTHQFYKTKVLEKKLAFPDLYLVFQADEKELRARKKNDKTRKRRNFEKHLAIIQPLQAYYRFLQNETDINLHFIQYNDLESTKSKVLAYLNSIKIQQLDHLANFLAVENWINKNELL